MTRPRRSLSSRALREAAADERAARRMAGGALVGSVADLSPESIALRQQPVAKLTARELGDRAASVLDAAHRAQRIAAKRRGGARQERANEQARKALLTAAVQIRMAEATPGLDTRPLLHLSFKQVQEMELAARRIVSDNTREQWGALAVDTHRRVQRHIARKRGQEV
jgi:hypothetical protein